MCLVVCVTVLPSNSLADLPRIAGDSLLSRAGVGTLGFGFLHLASGAENPKDPSFSDGSTRDENDLSFGFISRT